MMALALLLLSAAAVQAASPLDSELTRLEGKKMRLVRKLTAPAGEETLAVVLLKTASGRPRAAVRVYRVTAQRAKLLHLEPGFGKEVRLSDIHKDGKLPDLNGDGSRIIAYTTERRNIGQTTLVVLRYAKGKLERLADFPGGRFQDLDRDGRLEIVSRSRPLGKFFNVSCEETFHSLAQNAYRTQVLAWDGEKYASASRRHPRFFRKEIARTQARLDGVDIRTTERYGDYLGDSLTLFFLHDAIGEKRAGWDKFKKLFRVRKTDLPLVRRCYQKLRGELREKLEIPQSW